MVNEPPGSMATGAPFAVSVAAPSVRPRNVLTKPGTDGAIAVGTITVGTARRVVVVPARLASIPLGRTER